MSTAPAPATASAPGTAAASGEPGTAEIAEVVALLREIVGDPAVPIAADTRLEAGLRLDSVELAALSGRLAARHPGLDLLAHVATLSLDELIALTVGDVAIRLRRTR